MAEGLEDPAMKLRHANAFCNSVAIILVITALAKFYSLVAYHSYLLGLDPLLEIRSDVALGITGLVEICVAAFLVSSRPLLSKLQSILWLSLLFVLYRFGLFSIGYNHPCPCLGGPNSWVLLKFISWDLLMKVVVAYMLVLSIAFMIFAYDVSEPSG